MMKLTLIVCSLFMLSCASNLGWGPFRLKKPLESYSYCDGELWGYTVDFLGYPPDQSLGEREFNPKRPRLGLFLHMHTALSPEPKNTLNIFYVLRAKQDLNVKYKSKKLKVQVGQNIKKIEMEMISMKYPLRIDQLYPASDYDVKLHNPKKNEWKVGRRNVWLFNQVTDGYKVVSVPKVSKSEVDEGNVAIKFDPKIHDAVYLQFAANIWPYKSGLKNAVISVTIPEMIVDGKSFKERTFKFDMDYDKVKKNRGKRRCPSTEEIFRFN